MGPSSVSPTGAGPPGSGQAPVRLMFLICSCGRLVSVPVKDRGKPAMECKRCGDSMMPETVIELRRGVLGFRETRYPGAYCATCKIGVPVESHRSVTHQPLRSPPVCARASGDVCQRGYTPTSLGQVAAVRARSLPAIPFSWRGRHSRMLAWTTSRHQRVALDPPKVLGWTAPRHRVPELGLLTTNSGAIHDPV